MNVSPIRRWFAIALRTCVGVAGLLALSPAHAMSLCVGNVTLLKAALSIGQFQTQSYTIMLEQGTYALDADVIAALSAPTTVEGGYTTNCLARVVDPANTVIDIGAGHEFSLTQDAASPAAAINFDGFTMQNSTKRVMVGAGDFGTFSNDEGSVSLTHMRFTQLAGGADSGLYIYSFNGSIDLANVLIDHVSTAATCAVGISSSGGATIAINHMTADLPAGDDICLGANHDVAQIFIYNSILWNSDGGSSIFRGGQDEHVTLVFFNDIFHGTALINAPNVQSQINAAPGWISPAGGNYRLQTSPVAPAINSGTSVTAIGEPATDIEGHIRSIGSAPDRGAYESAFNDQSVLTVTNTLDSGAGSLRQAMLDANSSPMIAKSIKFDIRGANLAPICPAVIALNSALPTVASTMSIDGYTQPTSIKNSDAAAFNATLCVMVKPASGSLGVGFRVASGSGPGASLTLRGVGLGGFGQPIQLLGGAGHVIAGNQIGGVANGITLPGAGLSAVNIGVNAAGSLIVGGPNVADRNVIVDASLDGIDIQSGVQSSIDQCQVVNNLIGLAPDGHTALGNSFGINASGSGCGIVRNRIAGNSIANIWLNGTAAGNVVQQNQIGITAQGLGVLNNATGILVTGHDNVIGAGGNGGLLTANTIRFNVAGGVVVKGTTAIDNSVNANLIYDNGASSNGMDIDLFPTNGAAGPSANDGGDGDSGPNQQQNFPVAKGIVYTAAGTTDRPATVSGLLDTQPGTHRIDAYFSNAVNSLGHRGHAEIFLGRATVNVTAGVRAPFSMSVLVPNQSAAGVISFTSTDAAGNTSEIGPALATDTIFVDGAE